MRLNWRFFACCVVLLAGVGMAQRWLRPPVREQSTQSIASLEDSRRRDIYNAIRQLVLEQVVPPTKMVVGSYESAEFRPEGTGKLRVEIPMTGILPERIDGIRASVTAVHHFKTLAEVQRADEIRAFTITSLQLVATNADHTQWIGLPKDMRVY